MFINSSNDLSNEAKKVFYYRKLIQTFLMESLILAQDERWRRA